MPSCAIIYAVFPGCFKIRKAGVLAVLHKVTFTLFYPLFVLL